MEANKYQSLAMTTMNKELTKQQLLINAVMGLAGESGECVDLVKKHLFHNHPLDREKLILELGDVCWYIAEAATYLDIDMAEIFEKNIAKLKERYPEGFSSERSLNRAK